MVPAIDVTLIPDLILCDDKGKQYLINDVGDKLGLFKQNQILEHQCCFIDGDNAPSIAECMKKAFLAPG